MYACRACACVVARGAADAKVHALHDWRAQSSAWFTQFTSIPIHLRPLHVCESATLLTVSGTPPSRGSSLSSMPVSSCCTASSILTTAPGINLIGMHARTSLWEMRFVSSYASTGRSESLPVWTVRTEARIFKFACTTRHEPQHVVVCSRRHCNLGQGSSSHSLDCELSRRAFAMHLRLGLFRS
jgi:hypothetical protein